ERIIKIADQLFYRHGFEHTSFSDIAERVGISRGNFYHHFKTKDELLQAVIAFRVENTKKLLQRWEEQANSPTERIRSFIQILIMNRTKIKKYGCPVGSLCSELAKLDHRAERDATGLFTLFRDWLITQFRELGHKADASTLAMHLLARSQGVAVLANAYQDEKFIQREVKVLHEWLDTYI
ncbi:MAG: TetR/AcrR family transcriptional regulator, partial [Gammaproteobacteria bacterium]|nr:TetR/AcrR family transcriptional regulator [Gammaproteobacteria bacterium]